jgi:hypothetical protein
MSSHFHFLFLSLFNLPNLFFEHFFPISKTEPREKSEKE